MEVVIYGSPRTKKNGSRIVKIDNNMKLIPSKAYSSYQKLALEQLNNLNLVKSYDGPISICCRYYLADWKNWPDLVGLLQATSDILQDAAIISDDMWISDYNGSHIVGLDKENPRVEITINAASDESVLHQLKARRCDTTKRPKVSKPKNKGISKKKRYPTSISYLDYRKKGFKL